MDAITKEKVTSNTSLTALYDFSDSSIDNALLKNLTRVSEPAVRCFLVAKDGKARPHSGIKGNCGYDLYLRFNKLVSDKAHDLFSTLHY